MTPAHVAHERPFMSTKEMSSSHLGFSVDSPGACVGRSLLAVKVEVITATVGATVSTFTPWSSVQMPRTLAEASAVKTVPRSLEYKVHTPFLVSMKWVHLGD